MPKGEPKTIEEKMHQLLERDVSINYKTEQLLKRIALIEEDLQIEMLHIKKEVSLIRNDFLKMIDEMNQSLARSVEISQSCEENLLNVLLAIKQNEYLQAYYPAQRGYPEMKVVGVHPSKIKQQEAS